MNKTFFRVYIQNVKNILWHLPKAIFYYFYYGRPSKKLTLIGITGTDGKTTTVNLIHQCLQQSGIKSGLISTIGAKIGDKEIKIGLHTTSPDSGVVQKILRQMVDEGLTHAVIEVTAHALDQNRFFGCHFKAIGITNTSHEHLDDFLNMEHYIKTKAKIIKMSDFAILNKDDPSYSIMAQNTSVPIKTYSIEQRSDCQATDINMTSKLLTFNVNHQVFKTDSLFKYQIYNILLSHLVLNHLGIDQKVFINEIKHFPETKGRREIVKNDLGINCFVDFAHTPNALESTLKSLKENNSGKLIVIFGATGGRDPSKRPIMGKVVSEIADIAIITADDTRNEKVEDINQQIISGIKTSNKKFSYYNIPNRQDAFNLAIKLSGPGDTIIACGKGHETTILHGKTEYPWSESEAFRTAFRQKTL